MKIKQNVAFFFFLLSGVISGALLASLTAGVPYLSWLAYGKTIGIPLASPLVLDLAVLRLSLALDFSINVAQVVTVTLALLLYKRVARKL